MDQDRPVCDVTAEIYYLLEWHFTGNVKAFYKNTANILTLFCRLEYDIHPTEYDLVNKDTELKCAYEFQ